MFLSLFFCRLALSAVKMEKGQRGERDGNGSSCLFKLFHFWLVWPSMWDWEQFNSSQIWVLPSGMLRNIPTSTACQWRPDFKRQLIRTVCVCSYLYTNVCTVKYVSIWENKPNALPRTIKHYRDQAGISHFLQSSTLLAMVRSSCAPNNNDNNSHNNN